MTVPRPPALCQGCGHRDFYTALNQVLKDYPTARVFSDIGCYTLGWLAPFHAFHTCVEMGASVTMSTGAAHSGVWPSVAVIGDSTFTHSGMTGLLDAVNSNADITLCISDNLTTGMTGGPDGWSPSAWDWVLRRSIFGPSSRCRRTIRIWKKPSGKKLNIMVSL